MKGAVGRPARGVRAPEDRPVPGQAAGQVGEPAHRLEVGPGRPVEVLPLQVRGARARRREGHVQPPELRVRPHVEVLRPRAGEPERQVARGVGQVLVRVPHEAAPGEPRRGRAARVRAEGRVRDRLHVGGEVAVVDECRPLQGDRGRLLERAPLPDLEEGPEAGDRGRAVDREVEARHGVDVQDVGGLGLVERVRRPRCSPWGRTRGSPARSRAGRGRGSRSRRAATACRSG